MLCYVMLCYDDIGIRATFVKFSRNSVEEEIDMNREENRSFLSTSYSLYISNIWHDLVVCML
jgi:hypothetical protein